jgi:NADH:ubiquinone oxidoreductase subunit F (NADH-binding)
VSRLRLLAGPDLSAGAEPLRAHVQRLGPAPVTGRSLIDVLDRSGLTGRGGASFPVGKKWRAVAHGGGQAVVIANGAEGEPQSLKDRVLMSTRPHLVLDGALLAARTLKASQVVLYVGEEHRGAWMAMANALAERPEPELRRARLVAAPPRYVAGEASAAVNLVASSVASPTTKPPSPHEAGVGGAPTLVQNVETLGMIGLIARYGAEWYRSSGRRGAAGTMLVTVAGAVPARGVLEVEAGTTVREVLDAVGGADAASRAVLIGGYFGSWVDFEPALDLSLDAAALREHGLNLGCGVVGVISSRSCGVCETARIMRYLAGESSAQCGPCFFGLRALADACSRIAERGTNADDIARLRRWTIDVRGRGACHHPDGAVVFLQSALKTFAPEFANHPAHWRAQPPVRTGVA